MTLGFGEGSVPVGEVDPQGARRVRCLEGDVVRPGIPVVVENHTARAGPDGEADAPVPRVVDKFLSALGGLKQASSARRRRSKHTLGSTSTTMLATIQPGAAGSRVSMRLRQFQLSTAAGHRLRINSPVDALARRVELEVTTELQREQVMGHAGKYRNAVGARMVHAVPCTAASHSLLDHDRLGQVRLLLDLGEDPDLLAVG